MGVGFAIDEIAQDSTMSLEAECQRRAEEALKGFRQPTSIMMIIVNDDGSKRRVSVDGNFTKFEAFEVLRKYGIDDNDLSSPHLWAFVRTKDDGTTHERPEGNDEPLKQRVDRMLTAYLS